MAKRIDYGKRFEEDLSKSCKRLNIFCDRIKDFHIPFKVRAILAKNNIMLPMPKNKYDFYMFSEKLFPVELKSTKAKSFSFSEDIIKQHQIDALREASDYPNIIAGFIFNFREPENKAYFVHILDFLKYKAIAQADFAAHNYKSKINKSSIPIGICEEIGIEIKNKLPRTRHHYQVDEFVKEAIEKYKDYELE